MMCALPRLLGILYKFEPGNALRHDWLRGSHWLHALLLCLLSAASALAVTSAEAHKPSDSYLKIDITDRGIDGRWDIALRDLDVVFGLDTNGDLKLTWGEVRLRLADIDGYVFERLKLAGGACVPVVGSHAIDRHSDGAYLVIDFAARCKIGAQTSVEYRLFEDIDPTHRGIARVRFGGSAWPVVLDPARGAVELRAVTSMTGAESLVSKSASASLGGQTSPPSAGQDDSIGSGGFIRAGIHHILVGYDHILFVLCLLLPSVLVFSKHRRWHPAASPGAALWPVARIVTAFTVAHSLTLGLAASGIVQLSPRIIEPAIALTIIFAAVNNLRPIIAPSSLWMPFCFGLIHGFGFAGVLRDLELPTLKFAWALLRFNLGVEIGQLVVVGLALMPLYALRLSRAYRPLVLQAGSIAGITIAAVWFAERVFDFKLLPV